MAAAKDNCRTLTALKAMTIWPAVQYFEEASKGTIESGKLADFVILSDNPLAVKPEELITLKVQGKRTIEFYSPTGPAFGRHSSNEQGSLRLVRSYPT
jgi:imidazolonepropionase-like amidohydrolase